MDAAAELTRAYYDALDTGDYELLTEVLTPGFVQQRPDRTFDGRAAFIQFMREDRPATGTSHDLMDVIADGDRVVAHGTLFDADGNRVFEFVDIFTRDTDDGRFTRLDTFVRSV